MTLGLCYFLFVLFVTYLFRSTRSLQTASIPLQHTSGLFHSQVPFVIQEEVSFRLLPELKQWWCSICCFVHYRRPFRCN